MWERIIKVYIFCRYLLKIIILHEDIYLCDSKKLKLYFIFLSYLLLAIKKKLCLQPPLFIKLINYLILYLFPVLI